MSSCFTFLIPQGLRLQLYISTVNLCHYISTKDIQRTLTNIRYRQVSTIVNYFNTHQAVCHVFSVPFVFDRLMDIANTFPNDIFNYVTYLRVYANMNFSFELLVLFHVWRNFLFQIFNHIWTATTCNKELYKRWDAT